MKVRGAGLVVMVAALAAACNSNNPARPTMSFVAPVPQQPANGVGYNFSAQPVVLQIVNAVRTGSDAVTYAVEVSPNASFSPLTYSADGIAEGSGGTTSVPLPSLTGNTTYYWRWRAVVGGIAGEPSATQSFFLRPNITISAVDVVAPEADGAVFSARPSFIVNNATRTGPAGTIFYEFQVSASAAFSDLIATATIQEQGNGTTTWAPSSDLPEGTLFWRVRAKDPVADVSGPFTAALKFDRRFGIDLNTVSYENGPNISQWPQTRTLTAAYKTGDMVCTEFDSGDWPDVPFFDDPSTRVIGNQWVFINIGGVWHGGAGHWLRPGQFCKGEYDDAFFVEGFHNPPLNSVVLRSGDVFGIMVSTPARTYPTGATKDERSDVQMIVW
ncbi:MAG TPA: hypothetical protein VHB78_12825 [Vicinamibacterales bacterium]|jgi:hypothetical protein|nr:hypothetical protein [Vicinamibacterales bacterium]